MYRTVLPVGPTKLTTGLPVQLPPLLGHMDSNSDVDLHTLKAQFW